MIQQPRLAPLLSARAEIPTPHGVALLRLAFRPFYLGAAGLSVAWMTLWLGILQGALPMPAGASPLLWHAHEMLFGFVAAVVVGFLLTAGKVWTGLETPRGSALGLLWLLWLAGRMASLSGPPSLFAAIDTAFLMAAALVFTRLVVRSRNWRNLPVAMVLLALAAANACFHLAALGWLPCPPLAVLFSALALVVILTTVIGGRVIPAFTRSVTPGLQLREARWLTPAVIAASALGLALWVADAMAPLAAAVLAVAALLHTVRLRGWAPWAGRRRPILWILHVSYAWIPIGLALLSAATLGWLPATAGVHALAVGGIGGMVIGMMTRTARGHTGRALQASAVETTSYALVMLAATARVGLVFLPVDVQHPALLLAGGAWSLAFALYLCRFALWLCTTRADGKDG